MDGPTQFFFPGHVTCFVVGKQSIQLITGPKLQITKDELLYSVLKQVCNVELAKGQGEKLSTSMFYTRIVAKLVFDPSCWK